MYRGKATCKILKEIRKQIAKENDIAFVTSECKYQGDCLGTCPACEAEVRYLEEELRKRKQLGKTAVVTGVSLGLATTFLGCHFGGNVENPAVAPIYQGDGEDYKKFIQQHFKISPKIKKDLLYTPIIFKFTIEKNGKVGQIFTSSNILDPSLQKRWNKRCERAARRAIKAMPRWIPGKDVNRSPVRCCKDGIIIINNPIEVNDY